MNVSDDRELEELLAAEKLDPTDFAILNSLRAFYDENDPVPDGLVERIQFEITLDALHAEVATLTQLDLETSGARSAATESVRTITFTSESLTTMVTLTQQADGTGPDRRLGGARRRHPGRGAADRRAAGDVRGRRRAVRLRARADRAGQVRPAPGARGRRRVHRAEPDHRALSAFFVSRPIECSFPATAGNDAPRFRARLWPHG